MDIEKSINFLKNTVTRDNGFSPVFIANMDIVIGYAEKQLNDRWIPVSEKLPDVRQHESGESIEFIAMIKGAKVPTTLNISSDGNWFDYMYEDYNGKHTFDVLAWKPLPEPYKEKFNEG